MSLFDDASLVLIPDGAKDSKLYSVKPTDGGGDFTFSRSTTATRVNESGLIESVATNVPRIDYSEGGCPSLLLEPQRTNLLTYSEDFSTGWFSVSADITTDATISPDGLSNADLIEPTLPTDQIQIYQNISGIVSGSVYQFSYWLKSSGGFNPDLALYSIRDLTNGVWIDLRQSSTRTGREINDFIEYNVSFTAPSGCTSVRVYPIMTNTSGFECFIWGAQLEAGSYPTSYIPTNSAAVTRIADLPTDKNIGVENIGEEGVLFIHQKALVNGGDTRRITLSDGTNNNRVVFEVDESANEIKAFISSNGTTFALSSSNYNQTNDLKIAIKYTSNSCLLFINGVLEDTQVATGSPVGMNVLKFRRAVTLVPYYSGRLYSLSIFTEALTDSKCIALTTI